MAPLHDFAPAALHGALRDLGRADWLEMEHRDTGGLALRPRGVWGKGERELTIGSHEYLHNLLSHPTRSSTDLVYWWSVGRLAAGGAKVFRATLEQCEALAEVEARVDVTDYRQPFPTMVVELPAEWAPGAPRHVLLSHCDKLLAVAVNWHGTCEYVFTVSVRPGITIEDRLVELKDGDWSEVDLANHEVFVRMQRVAVNLAMLLTVYGATRPEHATTRSARHSKAARDRGAIDVEPRYFQLEQDVVLVDDRRASVEGDGTHASPRPHWRRGHFRMQRVGEGRREQRLTFVRPCLVMAEAFGGDPADTVAVYRSK